MKYILTINGKRYEAELERAGDFRPLPRAETAAQPAKGQQAFFSAAIPSSVAALTEHTVVSPVAGKIFEVSVVPGQRVEAGQPLMVLEAMKMETNIVAPTDGAISEMRVQKGDAVAAGQILAIL